MRHITHRMHLHGGLVFSITSQRGREGEIEGREGEEHGKREREREREVEKSKLTTNVMVARNISKRGKPVIIVGTHG